MADSPKPLTTPIHHLSLLGRRACPLFDGARGYIPHGLGEPSDHIPKSLLSSACVGRNGLPRGRGVSVVP